MKISGIIPYDLGDGFVISPDAKISIPMNGVTLKHGDHDLLTIPPVDTEIVTNSSGIILYINLPLTKNNQKWIRDNLTWFTHSA